MCAWYDDLASGAQDAWEWGRTEAAPVVRDWVERPEVVGTASVLAIVYPPVGVPLVTALAAADALAIAAETGDPTAAAQLAATHDAAIAGDPDAARFLRLVDEAQTWGSASGVSLGDLPPDELELAKARWDDLLQQRLLATRAASAASASSSAALAARAEHAGPSLLYSVHHYADGSERLVLA